ncbi:MAG: hypothetical protein ABI564_00395 [Ideonella sp.]
MSSRLIAMLVWGLAAASVVFWAMRLVTTAAPVPVGTRLAMNGPLAGGDLSRLLGAARVEATPATEQAPAAASRFRLTGIVSTNQSRSHDGRRGPGVALISVDGAPTRAYRVGDVLDSQFSLWSVALRSARIGDRSGSGTEAFVLDLPPPAAAATGSLAAAGTPAAATAPVPGSAARYVPPAPTAGQAPMMAPSNLPAPSAFMPPAPSMQPSDARAGSMPGAGMPSIGVPGSIQSDGSLSTAPPSNARQGATNSSVMRQ